MSQERERREEQPKGKKDGNGNESKRGTRTRSVGGRIVLEQSDPTAAEESLNVVAAQLPLTSVEADIAVTKNLLGMLNGPVVLVVTLTEAS